MIAAIQLVVTNASSGRGTLGKLLTDDSLYYSTASSMTNLNQILQKINQGNGTIGKLVNDQEFTRTQGLLQKLDKAADSLEDQGPLSVIGILAGPFASDRRLRRNRSINHR